MRDISGMVKKEIRRYADMEKAVVLRRFFKTGKGEYGEGDKFLGVNVPASRIVARMFFSESSLDDIGRLLESDFHEDRLTGLIMIVKKFERAEEKERKKIFYFYIRHIDRVNSWDLVDLSAPNIVGEWLSDKDKDAIYMLARSGNIWKKRVAIVSTFAFIKKNDLHDVFAISAMLLDDREDLIHKAVGWMLREAGKRNEKALLDFLEDHSRSMPRTALRYAIERLDEKRRKKILISSKK